MSDCPNCGARLTNTENQDSSDASLTKSFQTELGMPESDASELLSKYKLKMISPPCPYCGAAFTELLEPGEKVVCPNCRNHFLVEDSASKVIGDILKSDYEFPQGIVQTIQTTIRNKMNEKLTEHQQKRETKEQKKAMRKQARQTRRETRRRIRNSLKDEK